MTAPNIQLTIEPMVGGIFRYLPLAPATPGGPARFQFSFHARIRNLGSETLRFTELTIRFPERPDLPDKIIRLRTWPPEDVDLGPLGLFIHSGEDASPQDFRMTDNIILDTAPPDRIQFLVSADWRDDPAVFTYPLAPYVNGSNPGGYHPFGLPHELRRGEYWSGQSNAHCCGPQLFAHDIGVRGYDPVTKLWSDLLPGTTGRENKHYRCWGKSIVAIADGFVVSFLNNVIGNAYPGFQAKRVPTFGNHFILRHGDEDVVYAHMQRGSLNPRLMAIGPEPVRVSRGEFLGRLGNSGNSDGPHLHIHSIGHAGQMLRPLPWRDTVVTSQEGARPGGKRWVEARNQGLPSVPSFFYPSAVPPADDAEWSEWDSHGGGLTSGVTACSWARNRLDVFTVGTNSALYHRWWNGSEWGGWEDLGGRLTSKPDAVCWGEDRIDVFARGATNQLMHIWWNGERWSQWEDLGGELLQAPAVCSRREKHLDVFAVATNRHLYHRIWTGQRWTNWEDLGGGLFSDLAACSWDKNRIDVFGKGPDSTLRHIWWNGANWSGWEHESKAVQFAPTVCSRQPNHLDLFVVGPDNTIQHRIWNGSAWGRWETIGGYVTAEPGAVAWNQNRIDVFVRATDNSLYHTYWTPTASLAGGGGF